MGLKPGTQLGGFEITGILGKGGMGEVYRARDWKLDRYVAIKVLPADFAADPERLKRFEREAKVLASLDHPNIGALYEFQESEGVRFLVLQLVEGETLEERLKRSSMTVEEAIPIFDQIAEGLNAAHKRGVVHRDLKPANVKIDPEGRVKILDFGLAKPTKTQVSASPTDSTLIGGPTKMTSDGIILGTPMYMSPEQARGQAVDKQTDIWAFGCCLFQALSGELPFSGDSMTDLLVSIVEREPNLKALPKSTPRQFRILIKGCLEKSTASRIDDASVLRTSLSGKAVALLRKRRVALPIAIGTAAVCILALVSVGAYLAVNRGTEPETQAAAPAEAIPTPVEADPTEEETDSDQIRSIAILPFENLMNDAEQDYFVDGMTGAIISELSKIASLTVTSRTTVMRYKDSELTAPEFAKKLGVDAIVEGTVLREGDEVQIYASLIDGREDATVWSASYEEEIESVIKLHRSIALALAEEIRLTLSPETRSVLEQTALVNREAYDELLRGQEYMFSHDPVDSFRSISHFQKALDIEPNFVPALAHKAAAHVALANVGIVPARRQFLQAEQFANQTLALDPDNTMAKVSLGLITLFRDWDWDLSRTYFEEALEAAPNDPNAYFGMTSYRLFASEIDEANRLMLEWLKRDPEGSLTRLVTGFYFCLTGEEERGISILEALLAEDPNFAQTLTYLCIGYGYQGRIDECEVLGDQLVDLIGNLLPPVRVFKSLVLARKGRFDEGRTFLQEEFGTVSPTMQGLSFVALAQLENGSLDEGFHLANISLQNPSLNHFLFLRFLPLTPPNSDVPSPYLNDPRYWEIIERIGFPRFPEGHRGYDIEQAWYTSQGR